MVEEAAEGFSTAVARLQNARELQFLAQEAAAEKSRVEFKRSERKLFEAYLLVANRSTHDNLKAFELYRDLFVIL